MANMSYCRFENTLRDLWDCKDALDEGAKDNSDEMSEEERKSMFRLIQLCGDIYHEYEDYPTCAPDEDDYEDDDNGNLIMEYIYNSEDKNV